MPAGRLRERISLQRRGAPGGSGSGSEGNDGFGNSEGGWAEVFQCAAQFVPIKGREEVLAQRLQGLQPLAIVIRNSAQARAVTPDWRAVDLRSGRVYAVVSVQANERRSLLDLLCEGGGADG